jgi:surface polysaccharide O-acyltransferase-like enzyme
LSFGLLAGVSVASFVPLLLYFGPSRWFALGPFSEQASRVLLYAAYFFVGVAFGPAVRVEARRPVFLAAVSFALLLGVQIARLHWAVPPVAGLVCYGVAFALFCTAANLALLATFGRLGRQFAVLDSLSANAYGIYLIHYLFVVWGQYALLDLRIGAIPKAACVFTGALGLSWGCTAAMNAMLVRGSARSTAS